MARAALVGAAMVRRGILSVFASARPGRAWLGGAWLGSLEIFQRLRCFGLARLGKARFGRNISAFAMDWSGSLRLGLDRADAAWLGSFQRLPCCGLARLGRDRLGGGRIGYYQRLRRLGAQRRGAQRPAPV